MKEGAQVTGNEIYRAIFRDAVVKQRYSVLTSSVVVSNFDRLKEILGDELAKKFSNRFADWDLEKYLEEGDWSSISPSYLEMAYALNTSHRTVLVHGINALFAKLTSEEWLEILKKEAEPIGLLFEMHKLGEKLDLDTTLFDVMKTHAELIISGDDSPSGKYPWQSLPQMLSPPRRSSFYTWLRDRLVQRSLDADSLLSVLDLFGSDAVIEGHWEDRRKEIVRDILDSLLAAASVASLEWLEKNGPALTSVLKKSDADDREILVGRLDKLFEGAADDPQRNKIENLALALGVELTPVQEPKHESSASKGDEE